MSKIYRIFGLTIASALPLPALAGNIDVPQPDVVIDYGNIPLALAAPQVRGVRFEAGPGEFLLRMDGIARFYVQNGHRITITPEKGASEDDILPFLMGSAMGALLQQRRILVLHGSAIKVERESVVFCGPSGIGKSTLAAGFHKRGYRFLADDLCAISTHNGRPAVMPGFPRLKLWADTLKQLDTATGNLKSVRWGTDLQKYFLQVDNQCQTPTPIRAVFIIGVSNNDQPELFSLPGTEKFGRLIANSYRIRFLQGLGGKQEHFKLCSALAAKADIYRVVRPDKDFMLNELMELVAERFKS